MPRKGAGTPVATDKILLELPADLALDLEALSIAHYGAPKARLIREAIQRFIAEELRTQPQVRLRFTEARSVDTGRALRVVDGGQEPT